MGRGHWARGGSEVAVAKQVPGHVPTLGSRDESEGREDLIQHVVARGVGQLSLGIPSTLLYWGRYSFIYGLCNGVLVKTTQSRGLDWWQAGSEAAMQHTIYLVQGAYTRADLKDRVTRPE